MKDYSYNVVLKVSGDAKSFESSIRKFQGIRSYPEVPGLSRDSKVLRVFKVFKVEMFLKMILPWFLKVWYNYIAVSFWFSMRMIIRIIIISRVFSMNLLHEYNISSGSPVSIDLISNLISILISSFYCTFIILYRVLINS